MEEIPLSVEKIVNSLISRYDINSRYERKSRFNAGQAIFISPILEGYGFISTYPDRIVNSVYFDTHNLDFARANIDGDRFRFKARVRWYNSSKKRELEFKFRDGFNGFKKNYKLDGDHGTCVQSAIKVIKKESGLSLNPVVKITYSRSYYIDANNIRLTIDRNIRAQHIFGSYSSDPVNLDFEVVEFKYDNKLDSQFRTMYDTIVDYIPLRLTKSSKYTESIMALQSGFGYIPITNHF